MKNLTKDIIKEEVKKQYASLVSSPGPCSCCTKDSVDLTNIMKGNLIKMAGYDMEELKRLPSEVVENSFGCGNPLAFAEVKSGETVLDIGSGAGIDCILAAKKVGEKGKVIGLDMTQEMVDKAQENALKAGLKQVEFRLGEAENMPVEDNSVDWVISNCVINLSPEKPKVFSEIARILKPGGRFSISDIVLGEDLPEWLHMSLHAWTGCLAGSIKESEYVKGLENAGLTEVKVTSRIMYENSQIKGFFKGTCCETTVEPDEILKIINGKFWSAKIAGRKPEK
jgi:SAM-dependent methyltransferase